MNGYLFDTTDPSIIVVSTSGNDDGGAGSFTNPVKTLTHALSLATAARPTIFMLPGKYVEAAMITWPNVSGLSVIGMGGVSISNGNAAVAVIDFHVTYTAATFEATLKGINIAADTQIGIRVDNAHMSKKMMLYLDAVTTEMDTSGNSITVINTITTQAIRIYARDCSFEGLVEISNLNAGNRDRFTNCEFIGGITTTGAVAAEVALIGCVILTSGITIATQQTLSTVGCVYRTDADPAVYSNCANAFES